MNSDLFLWYPAGTSFFFWSISRTPESRFLVSKQAVRTTEIGLFPSNIFQENEILGTQQYLDEDANTCPIYPSSINLEHSTSNWQISTPSAIDTTSPYQKRWVEMSNCMVILLVVALLQLASGFSALRSPIRNVRFSMNMVQKEAFQLVLLRHGESSWNKENKFTGWYDCPLSEKGHAEAAAAGALLKEEGKWYLQFNSMQPIVTRTVDMSATSVSDNCTLLSTIRIRIRCRLHILLEESHQNPLAHTRANWAHVHPNHQCMGAKWEVMRPSLYAAFVNCCFTWMVHWSLQSILPF